MIKKIVLALIVIALGIGLFFYVRLQIQMYKAILYTQNVVADIVNFSRVEFPNQVSDYEAKMKAQMEQSAPLPTVNPAPAPTK